jgi:hypothetical protein
VLIQARTAGAVRGRLAELRGANLASVATTTYYPRPAPTRAARRAR